MADLFVRRVTFDGDVEESRFLSKPDPAQGERVLIRVGNTNNRDVMAPYMVKEIRNLGDRDVLVLEEIQPEPVSDPA